MATSIGVDCVFDTSCLIAFAQDRPCIAAVRSDEWLMWRQLDTIEELATYSDTLRYVGSTGKGDAATIALAAHRGLTAVLDDRVARNRTERLGLPYVGTLGIVADFVIAGYLEPNEAWQLLELMRSDEFRLKIEQAHFFQIIESRRQGQ